MSVDPSLVPRDRTTTLNVLALLGGAVHELIRGRDGRAILYLSIALVALKYKKFSLLLQGLITGGRMLNRMIRTGSNGRP